jgi:hypothetical protein
VESGTAAINNLGCNNSQNSFEIGSNSGTNSGDSGWHELTHGSGESVEEGMLGAEFHPFIVQLGCSSFFWEISRSFSEIEMRQRG